MEAGGFEPLVSVFSPQHQALCHQETVPAAFPKEGSTGLSGMFIPLLTLILQVLMNFIGFTEGSQTAARTRRASAKSPEVSEA